MKLYNYLMLSAFVLAGCHSHDHKGHEGHGHDHAEEAAGHAEKHDHGTDDIVFEPHQAEAAGLQTETVQPGNFTEVLAVSGQVLPAQGSEATAAATMSGIVKLPGNTLTDGTAVTQGQAMFTISAHTIADGNPAAQAQAELEAASKDYQRAKALGAENIISTREVEQARQRYEAAKAAANSLGNADQTRTITAPISGYIKNVLVKNGDFVNAGQPLATITQNRRLQLRAQVPERQYGFLPQIAGANFRLCYDNDTTVYHLSAMKGRLVSKGQASVTDDYFVPVTFEFDNIGDIIPGSFAEIWLLGHPREGVLSIPQRALTEAQGLYFVYVQTSDHTYRKTEVATGASDGSRIEITSGLKPGDTVVTKGVIQVKLAASGTVIPEGHSH